VIDLKPRISIVVGHDIKEQGATIVQTDRTKAFPHKTEYFYNVELSYYIVEALKDHFAVRVIFRDKLGITKTYDELELWDPKVSVELHFNSHENSKFRGTEVLVEKKWHRFGILMQGELVKALNRNHIGDRGVKIIGEGDRGHHSLKRLNCPDCIIEPFFGSNEEDALLGLKSMPEIGRAVAMAIAKWFARGEVSA